MQIYRGTHDQKGLSSGKQHDAALKVVQILGKNDNVFSMKEVSKVMYNNLPISNVQLWSCIALEAIMVRIHEKDRLRHFLAEELHKIFSSADTDKSGSLSYEEWEQAFGCEGVDKVMLKQLFDEMDTNKKNVVHTLSYFLYLTFSITLSLTHNALKIMCTRARRCRRVNWSRVCSARRYGRLQLRNSAFQSNLLWTKYSLACITMLAIKGFRSTPAH